MKKGLKYKKVVDFIISILNDNDLEDIEKEKFVNDVIESVVKQSKKNK